MCPAPHLASLQYFLSFCFVVLSLCWTSLPHPVFVSEHIHFPFFWRLRLFLLNLPFAELVFVCNILPSVTKMNSVFRECFSQHCCRSWTYQSFTFAVSLRGYLPTCVISWNFRCGQMPINPQVCDDLQEVIRDAWLKSSSGGMCIWLNWAQPIYNQSNYIMTYIMISRSNVSTSWEVSIFLSCAITLTLSMLLTRLPGPNLPLQLSPSAICGAVSDWSNVQDANKLI